MRFRFVAAAVLGFVGVGCAPSSDGGLTTDGGAALLGDGGATSPGTDGGRADAGFADAGRGTVDAGPPFTACNLGAMTGKWRYSFTETSGSCGPLLESTVPNAANNGGGLSCYRGGFPVVYGACIYLAPELTPDKCSVRIEFTVQDTHSVTQSGGGYQTVVDKLSTWQTNMTQTSATRVQGTGTVEIRVYNPGSTCRSTYNIVGVQLP